MASEIWGEHITVAEGEVGWIAAFSQL